MKRTTRKFTRKLIAWCLAAAMLLTIFPATTVSAASKINKEKIWVYGNSETKTDLQYFYKKYPQYKDLVGFVNEDDLMAIPKVAEQAMKSGKKYPSIVAVECSVLKSTVKSGKYATMKAIGLTDNDYKNAFDYTKKAATVKGELKAVTNTVCPGSFIYDRTIAKKVLGTDDPATVQKSVSSWNNFIETAKKMDAAGYKMLYSADDLLLAFGGEKTEKYKSTRKSLKKYLMETTTGEGMWSDGWTADMSNKKNPKVFGYFAAPWMLTWCIDQKAAKEKFNMCKGPAAFSWGGTYLAAGAKTPNPALAALVLKTICCNKDVMIQEANATGNVPNNKAAISKLNEKTFRYKPLKEQNALSVWKEVGKSIK